MSFKCPYCNVDMILRNGKYGEFYFCINEHGTISKKKADRLVAELVEHRTGYMPPISLLYEVRKQCFTLYSVQSPLIDWIVDNPASALDEDDHWMNIRNY